MPAELFKRVDLDLLYPPLRDELFEVVAECESQGATYICTCGFRSWTEQMKLYFQGRTAPGAKVTNAMGGESAHNFGLACDFARRIGGAISWKEEDYALLGHAAIAHGLAWGGAWQHPDRPHVQLRGYETREQLAPLRALKQLADEPDATWLARVWAEVERRKVPHVVATAV